MTNDTPAGPPADDSLSQAAVLELLRAGRTHAAEVLGDPHPRYLEALADGLAAGAEVAVVGDTDRAARLLADRGAVVRVAPLPPPEKNWWRVYVFRDDGVFQFTGLGSALDQRGWLPRPADWRTGLAAFGLLAPFDGMGFATSWERHPERLRAEYAAMTRHPERYFRRFGAELWLLPRVKLVQRLLALTSGLATALCLLRGLSVPFALVGILSGLVSVACHLYAGRVVRRLERFVTLPVDFWRN